MSRRQHIAQIQKPYLIAEAALTVLALLLLTLGPKGQVNWPGTVLLMLVPVLDSLRSIKVYKNEDEYAQKLILISAAFGFAVVMASLLVMSLLIVTQGSVDFASGTVLGVFIAGYGVYIGTQAVLSRRDATE